MTIKLSDVENKAQDPEKDKVRFERLLAVTAGYVSQEGGDLVFTPPPLFNAKLGGLVNITMNLNDGKGNRVTGLIRVEVTPVNTPPVATDAVFVFPAAVKDQVAQGFVRAVDPDGDKLTYKVASQPDKGTVKMGTDGSFTFSGAANGRSISNSK